MTCIAELDDYSDLFFILFCICEGHSRRALCEAVEMEAVFVPRVRI